LFAVARRATVWLKQNLYRWLVLPFVVVTAILTLSGALLGSVLIAQAFDGLLHDQVSNAALVAAHDFQSQVEGLAEATERVSKLNAASQAFEEPMPQEAEQLLLAVEKPMGVDTIDLVRAGGRSGTRIEAGDAGVQISKGTGVAPDWLREPAVSTAVAQLLQPHNPSPAVRVGVAGQDNNARLYAIGQVVAGDRAPALLVASVPMGRVLKMASASLIGSLVYYDVEGQPLYSTLEKSGVSFTAVPNLPQQSTAGSDQTRVLTSQIGGNQKYAYGVHPIIVGGQTVAYAAVWRSADDVRADALRWQIGFVLVIVAGAACIMLLSLRLVRQAVTPVGGMVRAAQSVAEGDFGKTVPQDAIGELGVLAGALNDMAGQVQQQTGALREQAQRSTYLFDASAELGRTLDLDDSFDTAAEAIKGLDRVSYVVVLTGRGELGPYTCNAVRGLPPDVANQVLGHEYPVPLWGVMARALVSRQPLVIDDIVSQNRPRAGEFNWDVMGGSMLLFPVCGATGPFALIIIGAAEPNAFSHGDLGDLVFALVRIASHSIQNAHLYREALRSQEQLVTLQVISRLVASSSQIEKVLDVVMREAAEVMGDSQVWLYLKDAGAGTRRLYSRPKIADSWGPVHQDAAAWVIQAGQPIFYNPEYPLVQSPILVHSGPAMCVPLETEDETIGALVVSSYVLPRTFIEDDMIVLRTLANAAAAALRTRQLAQRFANGFLELAGAWGGHADRRVWGCTGHSERVAHNALNLASGMDVPVELLPVIQVASYLHDIAAESAGEDTQVCGVEETVPHAAQGADWLADAGLDSRVVTLVRYHHLGRPDLVIEAADLSRAAGALALVHAADTWLMSVQSDPAAAMAEVHQRLKIGAGGLFIPAIVDKFNELLGANQIVLP